MKFTRSCLIGHVGLRLLAGWLCLQFGLACAMPPAGTVIANTARVCYTDSDSGFRAKISSNTVQVVVQGFEALELQAAPAVRRAPGGQVAVYHRLVNVGNAPAMVSVSAQNRSADDFDLQSLSVTLDANGNGVADTGEVKVSGRSPIGPLLPGQSMGLILTGQLPTVLSSGLKSRLSLTVHSSQTTQTVDDVVEVADGAALQVFAASSAQSPMAGERVALSLTASNTGNMPVAGVPVVLDGVSVSRSLLRSDIPPNTRFVRADAGTSGSVAYHLRGMPESQWLSAAPSDLAQVDAVGFAFDQPIQTGQSISRTLWLDVNANVNGPLRSQAQFLFSDGVSVAPLTSVSNTVEMSPVGQAPQLKVFGDSRYQAPTHLATAGKPLYVAFDAAQCNQRVDVAESHRLQVSAQLSGDTEVFDAIETGPNTGVFHVAPNVPTRDAKSGHVVSGDGVISVLKNDHITVTMLGCGADMLQAEVLVDPFGVVYDSRSNALIAGARVTLIDVLGSGNGGHAGGLAEVFMADGITRSSSELTTGADGAYQFPLVRPSTYRLEVVPPAGLNFPSRLPSGMQPPDRVVRDPVSYGGHLLITRDSAPVQVDLPVDADANAGFFLQKSVNRSTAEVGEFVDYALKVKNLSGALLGQIELHDRLPAGFAYVPGSVRLNGQKLRWNGSALPEPDGGRGPRLVFHPGSLDSQGLMTLTYKVSLGPGALRGDGVNRAQALSASPLPKVSNESSARVQVLPGVFADKAYVVGEVLADCSSADAGTSDRPGVGGVRLFLDDGTSVSTDGQGRFSLYGLRARTHVLKVDPTSLPSGMAPLLTSHRQAGQASSFFVDLRRGELQRVQVLLGPCGAETSELLQARKSAAEANQEIDWMAESMQKDERAMPVQDPKSLPSQGLLKRSGQGAFNAGWTPTQVLPTIAKGSDGADFDKAPEREDAKDFPSDDELSALPSGLGFMRPAADEVLGQRQTRVLVRAQGESPTELLVNGLRIPATQIGRHVHLTERGLHVYEYVGIALLQGRNELLIRQGTQQEERRVRAAGDVDRLVLSVDDADSRVAGTAQRIKVRVRLLDAAGLQPDVRLAVTLDASSGRWLAADANLQEPGLQVFVEHGESSFDLAAPEQAGDVSLQVRAGLLQAQHTVHVQADLRPMLMVGLVEGQLSLGRLRINSLSAVRREDGFEDEIMVVAGHADQAVRLGARTSLFVKGKVRGDVLLTMAYDSQKSGDTTLFRDIQPDQFYPVYGDASSKGFDAQSTGKLYVRLDQRRSHFVLGDFQTTLDAQTRLSHANGEINLDERRLSRVNRALHGAQLHAETDDSRSRLVSHYSETHSQQAVDEFPAVGISGPYVLKKAPLVENSERVEIISRDRQQRDRVLDVQRLARFTDYEIDVLTGRILLRAPAPSFDADLNPRFIRVAYETAGVGASYPVAGLDFRHRLSEQVTLGGSWYHDGKPGEEADVKGLSTSVTLGDHSALVMELAQGSTALGDRHGLARRLEVTHENGPIKLQVQATQLDLGFTNLSAGMTPGVAEFSLRGQWRTDSGTLYKLERLQHREEATGQHRETDRVGVQKTLSDSLRLDASVQHRQADLRADQNTMAAKLLYSVPGLQQAVAYLEHEQDLAHSEQRMTALGGEWQTQGGTRLYARHTLQSSLTEVQDAGTVNRRYGSLLGASSEVGAGGQVFSEYRISDALSQRDAEAALGMRQRWAIGSTLTLHGGLETVKALTATSAAAGQVVNAGVEWAPDLRLKMSERIEWRTTPDADTWLNVLGMAYRLDEQWTGLIKSVSRATDSRHVADSSEASLQLGAAYRGGASHPWTALTKLQFKRELQTATDPLAWQQRHVLVLSGHANWRADAQRQYAFRVAAKWATESSADLQARQDMQLVSAKASWMLTPQVDAVLNAHALLGARAKSAQFGLGMEVGRLLAEGLWASMGFNFFTFRDADLLTQHGEQPGLYFKIRWKFDENSF